MTAVTSLPEIGKDTIGKGEWFMDSAACHGLADGTMFPERGADVTRAKAICAGCMVRVECLTYALTEPVERYGIWGGLSERQRRAIRLGAADRFEVAS